MTAKEYLSQVRQCHHAIDRKRKQLDKARRNYKYITGISYDRDKIQTSPIDGLSEAVVNIVQLEQDIESVVFRYAFIIDRCVSMINGMDKEQHKNVLFERYVEEKDFETIASEMHVSYYRICHVHGEALQEFAKKYPEIAKR